MKNMIQKKAKWKIILITLLATIFSNIAQSHETDDPILMQVMLDQLEVRGTDDTNPAVLEAQAWIGKDLNKFWLKTDIQHRDDQTESAELQGLYSHAIAPFWDMQIGVRQDIKPTPSRTWAVMGAQGIAPYYFAIDAALFVGESGHTAARFAAEYDLLFTQRLILSPKVKINIYGQNDPETNTGCGLSDVEAGLRLRYEIRREFAPYVGINWHKKFGATAEFVNADEETVSDTQWVIGLRAWF